MQWRELLEKLDVVVLRQECPEEGGDVWRRLAAAFWSRPRVASSGPVSPRIEAQVCCGPGWTFCSMAELQAATNLLNMPLWEVLGPSLWTSLEARVEDAMATKYFRYHGQFIQVPPVPVAATFTWPAECSSGGQRSCCVPLAIRVRGEQVLGISVWLTELGEEEVLDSGSVLTMQMEVTFEQADLLLQSFRKLHLCAVTLPPARPVLISVAGHRSRRSSNANVLEPRERWRWKHPGFEELNFPPFSDGRQVMPHTFPKQLRLLLLLRPLGPAPVVDFGQHPAG